MNEASQPDDGPPSQASTQGKNSRDGIRRRQFLELAGAGAASALAASGAVAGTVAGSQREVVDDHRVPLDKNLTSQWLETLMAKGVRTPYRGESLETIGMPCGGVCAGQLYVRGDGTLAQWWIANNAYNTGYGIYYQVNTPLGCYPQAYSTFRPPSPIEQGFAICVQPEGEKPQVRTLDREGFDAVRFFGEYPIATIEYGTDSRPALPVGVQAEVFSPFIPLSARDSAIPATVLRYTVTNTSGRPVDVSITGWLQNGVMLDLAGRAAAESRNTVVRSDRFTAIAMDTVAASEGAKPSRQVSVFEDFDDGTYDQWKTHGEAFGAEPATGALGGQPGIANWQGKYFVNSFRAGSDEPQGRMISQPFPIRQPYITFLIGGGRFPKRTSINLVVDGQTVRTATGTRRESLEPEYWHVGDLLNKRAHLEIIDHGSESGDHINIDHICFADVPPRPEEAIAPDHPQHGQMALAALDTGATATAAWESKKALLAALGDGRMPAGPDRATRALGENLCGAVASGVRLAPGQSKTLSFVVAWYFPNREQENEGFGWGKPAKRGRPVGNMYANWFAGARDVVRYVADHFDRLVGDTVLFRDTYFDTTLPYWFAQRIAMPLANLATETCQWWANGRFWAWEGVGCCFGTCNHVWNYAQGMGRVFPELERSVRRMQDFTVALDQKSGAVAHRGLRPSGEPTVAVLDGQAGTILKAYREHLTSPDDSFLIDHWPKIRLALDWLVGQDGNDDGMIDGEQPNTYDIAFFGANSFVGSLYLAAVRAAEVMARAMDDSDLAKRLGVIARKGSRNSVKRLFNGEYFIQDVDPKDMPSKQYANGCLSDQLFGQAWAHQLGLGYIYPEEHVLTTLESIWRYNWAPDVGPQNEIHHPERFYAHPGEPGLIMCTWPKGGRPLDPVRYKNEVWTGIEYQVAAHMLHEGMVTEALSIVRGVHERYNGAGHNPFNEIECGDHYARSLASWGCLLAASGYVYDGPAGRIGFAPRLGTDDFKAFFTAAEGWGSLVQRRDGSAQTNRIEVRWGRLRVKTLVLELPDGVELKDAAVTVAGKEVDATAEQDGRRVTIILAQEQVITRDEAIESRLEYSP